MASGIEFVLEDEKQEELNLFIDSYKGLSAYEVAVKNGFSGTEKEWVDSLHTETAKQEIKQIDYNDLVNLPTYCGKPIKGSLVLGDYITSEDFVTFKKELVSLIPPQVVIDGLPQDNSKNAVSSSGVKKFVEDAVAGIKIPTITIDDAPQDGSTNAVSSGGVKKFIDNAVAAIDIPSIAIDDVPQSNSKNCISSGGVKEYVDTKVNEGKKYTDKCIELIKKSLQNCIVKVTTCDTYLTRTTGGILKPINNTKTVLHKITGCSEFDGTTWHHFVLRGFRSTSQFDEEDSIVLNSPIELMQYDYIDFDKQELVRQTKVSGNEVELCEKITSPITIENKYTVYTNGTEEVLTDDNLAPQITQDYLKYILEE